MNEQSSQRSLGAHRADWLQVADFLETSMKRCVKPARLFRGTSPCPDTPPVSARRPFHSERGARANVFQVSTVIKLAPSRRGEVLHSSIRALISGRLSPAHGKIRMEEPRSL